MTVFEAAGKTLAQMPERDMRLPVLRGLVATIVMALVLSLTLFKVADWLLTGLTLPWIGTIGDIGSDIGGAVLGVGALVAVLFLFFPAAALAVSFFIDGVANAVERRHYPDAPPARNRPLGVDLSLGVRYALLALGINLVLLPFLFIFPPVVAAANGWLLAREYFEMAALRRHDGPTTKRLRRSVRGRVILSGFLVGAAITVPVLNIFVPVFGAGLMTHIYNGARRTM